MKEMKTKEIPKLHNIQVLLKTRSFTMYELFSGQLPYTPALSRAVKKGEIVIHFRRPFSGMQTPQNSSQRLVNSAADIVDHQARASLWWWNLACRHRKKDALVGLTRGRSTELKATRES
jgi:hypothetical protein